MRKQFAAAGTGFADLIQDAFQARPFAALSAAAELTVPDHAADGVGGALGGAHDVEQRRTKAVGVRQQPGGHLRLELGQRCRTGAIERHIQRNHHLALPAGRSRITLVAGAGMGAHQIFAPGMHHHDGYGVAVDRHRRAERYPALVGTGDDAIGAIEQEHVGAIHAVAVGGKDAPHFFSKCKAQAQHADHPPGHRVAHAARIDQRFAPTGLEFAGAEGFDPRVAGQCLRQQRVGADVEVAAVVEPNQYPTMYVEQNDFFVHRVFVTIGAQALGDSRPLCCERRVPAAGGSLGLGLGSGMDISIVIRIRIRIRISIGVRISTGVAARDEIAQFLIGRQETDVGGAFVQITHHDLDDVLRAGGQLIEHVGHFLMHEVEHQFVFELTKRRARGGHRRQDRLRLERAVQLGRGLDHAPVQVQFMQGLFALADVAHVRQE